MPRVAVKPELLRWAVDRAASDVEALADRPGLAGLPTWERGDARPTFKQLETFCDKAAAEFLVPERELKAVWNDAKRAERPFEDLAGAPGVRVLMAAERRYILDADVFITAKNRYYAFDICPAVRLEFGGVR